MDELIEEEVNKRQTSSIMEINELQTQILNLKQELDVQCQAAELAQKQYLLLQGTYLQLQEQSKHLATSLQSYSQTLEGTVQKTDRRAVELIGDMGIKIKKLTAQLRQTKELLERIGAHHHEVVTSEILHLETSLYDEREQKQELLHQNLLLRNQIDGLKQQVVELKEKAEEKPVPPKSSLLVITPKESMVLPPEDQRIIEYVNHLLRTDESVHDKLPLGTTTGELAQKLVDGIVLWFVLFFKTGSSHSFLKNSSKLINIAAPSTIDERVLKLKPTSREELEENISLCTFSSLSIGIPKAHILFEDWLDGNVTEVMSIIRDIVEVRTRFCFCKSWIE